MANRHLSDRYWRMAIDAPAIAAVVRPGQFVLVTPARSPAESIVLPRPMAIADVSDDAIEIVYGVIGGGTRQLAGFRPGEAITVVGPLGRPFHLPAGIERLLVLGRGIGICSLTLAARACAQRRVEVVAMLSGRHDEALVCVEDFRRWGVEVRCVTDSDGTSDPEAVRAGLVAAFDAAPPTTILTCGSERLAAVASELCHHWQINGQVSIEAHMACGLGYCHGCSTGKVGTETEAPLACTVGPVFGLA